MADGGNWCLIESDPGVFTEMLRGFGVKGLQVEELYTLEEEEFFNLRPIHGLVFLFKWRQGEDVSGTPAQGNDIFFAQQVIVNACATQALVNLLMNMEETEDIQMGNTLRDYRKFTREFDPSTRGLCLSNSEDIRTVHNSFARPQLWELDTKSVKNEEDYHFVTYLPLKGKVYELDGLLESPIEVGEIKEGQDWLDVVRPVIQARMQRYSDGEIHFNLMAVISERKAKYIRRLEALAAEGAMENVAREIGELQSLIEEEDAKEKRQKTDNIRRRHNYVPFIVELLHILAKENKLVQLVEQAQTKVDSKVTEKEEEAPAART